MSTSAIFVYGTLQRGEEREKCWPCPPTLVEWATVRGRLYDLGPYPALVAGPDLVLGELWQIAARDLAQTLEVLDAIEGYGQQEPDRYVRKTVNCQTVAGRTLPAQTYIYARPADLKNVPVVAPNHDGWCHWRAAQRGRRN